MSELYNYSGPFKDRNACIKKQKNTQCKSGLESMCVLYIKKDMCYSGCGKRVSMKGMYAYILYARFMFLKTMKQYLLNKMFWFIDRTNKEPAKMTALPLKNKINSLLFCM